MAPEAVTVARVRTVLPELLVVDHLVAAAETIVLAEDRIVEVCIVCELF